MKKQNTDSESQHLEEDKDWRIFFKPSDLEKAGNYLEKKQYQHVAFNNNGASGMIGSPSARRCARISSAPQCYTDEWDEDAFSCDCQMRHPYRWSGYYSDVKPCAHLAALFMLWEKAHGPWHFRETDEEMEERLLEERIEAEINRREKQKERESGITFPASHFFADRKGKGEGTFFDIQKAMAGKNASRYAMNRAKEILHHSETVMPDLLDTQAQLEREDILKDTIKLSDVKLIYGDDGSQKLEASCEAAQFHEGVRSTLSLDCKRIDGMYCSCKSGRYYYQMALNNDKDLCEHELALLSLTWDYVDLYNPGDATDKNAEKFFAAFDHQALPAEVSNQDVPAEKEHDILLQPRISMESGMAKLSFKLGRKGQKALILKGFRKFLDAVEQEKLFEQSKTTSIDFAKEDFVEESLPWLTFIQRRVSETDVVNNKLQSRRGYYIGGSISVQNQETLSGALLDRFYDLALDTKCEYQDKSHGVQGMISIGHANMKVRLVSDRIEDSRRNLIGVEIRGNMPVILEGSADNYILSADHLSRISKEEAEILSPFQSAADRSGDIRFRVGKDKLAEFYYRVVPELINNAYVDFEDTCQTAVEALLPPEPEFVFRLDLEETLCTLKASVSYEETTYPLKFVAPSAEKHLQRRSGTEKAYRDSSQEERVLTAVARYFPHYDTGAEYFFEHVDEDGMYRILTQAVGELSAYGTVLGSDAFRTDMVRPMPQIRVGVSLESGLLDVSVISKDVSVEELLELLESYRVRKKYHRMKNGDFIALTGDKQMDSLNALAKGMDLTSEQLVHGGMAIPAYRALYLDHMLEQHEELITNRSRTYRALIKNFHTIRDADYEVPDALAEVLRPYQVYGYKWLRTLYAAGFGGILADEMGLGKTLQTIALFLALKEEGNQAPCLVVCPASLVYNWQEEIKRFAPLLAVTPVAGGVAVRKNALKSLHKEAPGDLADVYITSYDLLRKDVQMYENLSFSVMFLDEAQYIKNQKAALTKAVKVIKAEHRFALTGTPIENRLAELWSIFDFLMPGFLYSYDEFSKRFETPIIKTKDAMATDRLKQMVSPFILRRLKAEVLKDLPAKLEEVRYARFDDKQRKVYDGQVVRMKKLIAESGNAGEDKVKVFAELTRLRQICCDPSLLFEDYDGESAKRSACLELIQNAIGGGHRMLLFSQFTSMLALLEEDLKREKIEYYKITGSTPKEQRIRLVHAFNENQIPVFLISLKAGGTGLNLTGADIVIHYDPWWNLAAQNQATDRAHRIGQTRAVTVYRMIMKDTIEEKILALQEAKKDLADAILSGENTSLFSLSGEELLELLS